MHTKGTITEKKPNQTYKAPSAKLRVHHPQFYQSMKSNKEQDTIPNGISDDSIRILMKPSFRC